MYNDICQKLSFAMVPEDVFCVNTVYFMKENPHIKFLLGVLNSKIINWYYRTLSVQLGETAVRMFSIYVEKIPIPMNDPNEALISSLVEKINETNDTFSLKTLESEIDDMVCKMYGLNNTEIEFIYSNQ